MYSREPCCIPHIKEKTITEVIRHRNHYRNGKPAIWKKHRNIAVHHK